MRKKMEDIIMNITSTSLSTSDMIYATLEVGGRTLASVSKSNFTTTDDIVRFICAIAGRFMGLARLNIRNKTQGWSMNMALASTHPAQHTSLQHAMPNNYRQASLFN